MFGSSHTRRSTVSGVIRQNLLDNRMLRRENNSVRVKFISTYLLRFMLDPLWPKFQSVILEENHRQGDDKSYGDMLNRIRVSPKIS